jgi:hypothetical protein
LNPGQDLNRVAIGIEGAGLAEGRHDGVLLLHFGCAFTFGGELIIFLADLFCSPLIAASIPATLLPSTAFGAGEDLFGL